VVKVEHNDEGFSMQDKRILFVDNEEDQRVVVQRLLTKLGYNVQVEASPWEALRRVENERFDLVITDLIMPEMDGTELCERIRKASPQTIIYAFSGYFDLFEPAKIARAGFDGHLDKPLQLETFEKQIRQAFAKGGARES
jgi:CheY-like chemotaxis protein